MRVVLLSTYELGHQPFGLASPAAWLRRAGADVTALDLSRQRLDESAVQAADAVGIYLPMHTATRLALPVLQRVRQINSRTRICAFGLYAPPNADLLQSYGVSATFGPEFEADIVEFAALQTRGAPQDLDSRDGLERSSSSRQAVRRLTLIVPDRAGLPMLSFYASLHENGGRRIAGYTEASRGCKHMCRHCPVVPIYNGQFRIVPLDVVIADICNQVEAGATHITFGDPDFFNGPAHADRIVSALHRAFPTVTYDVTIKVDHLLRHARLLPRLRETGCLFITTAVESVDDAVLARLEKGHTAADFERVVALVRNEGLQLAPTFVPFTPWTTIEGYVALLETIRRLDLIPQVAPVQLGIRLLIPNSSRLLQVPEIRSVVGEYDTDALAYRWVHPDSRVDDLQRAVLGTVGRHLHADRDEVFRMVWRLATAGMKDRVGQDSAGEVHVAARPRTSVPYLNEPWYC